ncbi:MAG: class I SAM-dependent methyltransferase [Planctomycetes bacterium]|nr:class I SAM-dependent methyltransferase [Planctomycetota bacterium]
MNFEVLEHPGLPGHALLDSGGGEKLERFGDWTLRRPDPQSLWQPRKGPQDWDAASLRFERESDRGGHWVAGPGERPPESWELPLDLPGLPRGCRVRIQPTPFKHVGLFPEQAANWLWVEQRRAALESAGAAAPRLLNLFAYTGVASIFAAKAGWQVTHVDASKTSLDWAAANARLSGLPDQAVRWLLEDAAKFAARELRRGNTYHGVLLDPPAYGRGPKGEKWHFGADIAPLLETCRQLLEPSTPSFLLLSAYAIDYSPLAFHNLLAGWGGQTQVAQLALPEAASPRLLPCGFVARWCQAHP